MCESWYERRVRCAELLLIVRTKYAGILKGVGCAHAWLGREIVFGG